MSRRIAAVLLLVLAVPTEAADVKRQAPKKAPITKETLDGLMLQLQPVQKALKDQEEQLKDPKIQAAISKEIAEAMKTAEGQLAAQKAMEEKAAGGSSKANQKTSAMTESELATHAKAVAEAKAAWFDMSAIMRSAEEIANRETERARLEADRAVHLRKKCGDALEAEQLCERNRLEAIADLDHAETKMSHYRHADCSIHNYTCMCAKREIGFALCRSHDENTNRVNHFTATCRRDRAEVATETNWVRSALSRARQWANRAEADVIRFRDARRAMEAASARYEGLMRPDAVRISFPGVKDSCLQEDDAKSPECACEICWEDYCKDGSPERPGCDKLGCFVVPKDASHWNPDFQNVLSNRLFDPATKNYDNSTHYQAEPMSSDMTRADFAEVIKDGGCMCHHASAIFEPNLGRSGRFKCLKLAPGQVPKAADPHSSI